MLRSESAGGYPEGTTPTSWGEHVTDHGRDAGGRRMLGELIAASHLMSMEELPGAVAERAADAGFPEVLIYFIVRHHADELPVAETLRRLVNAVMEYHGGRLQDDATVLLCEWLGPPAVPDRYEKAARLAGLPEPAASDPGPAEPT